MAIEQYYLTEQIQKELKYTNFKRNSSKSFSVLTEPGILRVDVMNQILQLFKGLGARKELGGSSIGRIRVESHNIMVKPASRQGISSAGLENEMVMVRNIEKYTKGGPVDIVIKHGNRRKTYKDIKEVREVGRDTAGGKKADVILVNSGNRQYPISIKQDNAVGWSSMDKDANAMTMVNLKLQEALDSGKVVLEEVSRGVAKIVPDLAFNVDSVTAKRAVFGTDNPIIVVRTFSDNDFNINDDGQLVITTSKLFKSMTDINNDKNAKPIWIVRNDKTRNVRGLPRGIRAMVVTQKRLTRQTFFMK